jgi:hypothetical protein
MHKWEAEAQAAVARAQAAVERTEAAGEAHAARAAEARAACAVAEHTHTTAAIQSPLLELQSPEVLSRLEAAREMVRTASELLPQLADAHADLNEEAAEELRGQIIKNAREAEVRANGTWQFIMNLGVSGGAME